LALIFSSGGGRLGNQMLNLIHLIALNLEYDLEIIKVNDNSLISNNGRIIFNINKKKINWKVSKDSMKGKYFYKLLIKIFIRLIHIYFYLSPFNKSYKIGLGNNYPKFILANNLRNNFSMRKLIYESKKFNVVLSGWGLRDWDMVLKHKKSIMMTLKDGLSEFLDFYDFKANDYLLVHMRRNDFLEVKEYKELNFEDKIWIKSIRNLCYLKGIRNVILFSDSIINKYFISSLEKNSLKVIVPEIKHKNINFLKLFFSYVYRAKFVLCNASSLILSIAFISQEKIYIPSREKEFEEVSLNSAHSYYPISINWN
tara:strand:- start:147 stop:1082 length:936 start_codon:yes stop_codon:yes gene_type:complete